MLKCKFENANLQLQIRKCKSKNANCKFKSANWKLAHIPLVFWKSGSAGLTMGSIGGRLPRTLVDHGIPI